MKKMVSSNSSFFWSKIFISIVMVRDMKINCNYKIGWVTITFNNLRLNKKKSPKKTWKTKNPNQLRRMRIWNRIKNTHTHISFHNNFKHCPMAQNDMQKGKRKISACGHFSFNIANIRCMNGVVCTVWQR